MSEYEVSLRLIGDIGDIEGIVGVLPDIPYELNRQGEIISGFNRPWRRNVLLVQLARWQRGNTGGRDAATLPISDGTSELTDASSVLAQLEPSLNGLDRTRCSADIYVDIIDELDQAGLELPAAFVSAASAAGLPINIIVLVVSEAV